MRGALEHMSNVENDCGIIPADAGSTAFMSCTPSISWDHPRGCGEHHKVFNASVDISGSSPRMRGAPAGVGDVDQALGIIPADAGSTSQVSAVAC